VGRGLARIIPVLLFAGAAFAAPTPSHAFCVANNTKVKIHAQSLSSSKFEADITPGKQSCSGKNVKKARILVVTGYVPVAKKKKSKPGWKAECRAQVKMNEWVDVKGTAKKISCKVRRPIPKKWLKK